MKSQPKRKIFNDPVYGFITVPSDLVFQLISHPYFQRLRRIRQLGLTSLVYPGANHTRFHHAMGSMHLMHETIEVIRSKGHTITHEEAEGALIAILLHDIGHGPFSHALETSIVHHITHEDISGLIMDQLNKEFKGQLSTAISIFRNKYKKKFLHQLVSSQLDMDNCEQRSHCKNAERGERRIGGGRQRDLLHREVHYCPKIDVLASVFAQDSIERGTFVSEHFKTSKRSCGRRRRTFLHTGFAFVSVQPFYKVCIYKKTGGA